MDMLDIILGSEMSDEIGNVVIDLTKFNCQSDFGTNFNDVAFFLFGSLLMAGGGTQKVRVQDIDGKFKQACTDAHNFKVRLWIDADSAIDIPVAYAVDGNTAGQFGCSFVLSYNGIYIESAMNVLFYDSNNIDIFNKVTILSA